MSKKLIYLFVLIVLSTSIIAWSPMSYWKFDNNALDSNDVNDFTEGAGITYNTTHKVVGSHSAYFDGGANGYTEDLTFGAGNITAIRTIQFWVYPLEETGDDYMISFGDDASNFITCGNSGGGGVTFQCRLRVGDVWKWALDTAQYLPTDQWEMVTIVFGDGGNAQLWLNNTFVTNDTETDVGGAWTTVVVGSYFTHTNPFNMNMDNLATFDYRFTEENITASYNSGSGLDFLSVVVDTINISDPFPTNNTQFNPSLLNFNLTVNATNTFNASLYINDTLNQTLTGFSSGTDVLVDFNISFTGFDGSLSYFINVYDNVTSENTTTSYFFVDNIQPVINWTYPKSDNSTVLNHLTQGNFFNTSIYLTDNNLYSYEYNITYANGSLIYNQSNSTLTGLTVYNYTHSLNMSDYTGTYLSSMRVCDGHTNNQIKFGVTANNTKLNFDGVIIYPFTKNNVNKYTAVAQSDRYSFVFNTTTTKNSLILVVESDEYIDILNGTGYKGHIVTKDRWVDFEGDFIDSVDVIRFNDTRVYVTVTPTHPIMEWAFNSIGELNCINEIQSFSITDGIIISTGGGGGGGSRADETIETLPAPTCENLKDRFDIVIPEFFNKGTIENAIILIQTLFDWVICETQITIVDVNLNNLP